MLDLWGYALNSRLTRSWHKLSWGRLLFASAAAPLPALYIGFAAFALAYSDRNWIAVYRHTIDTLPFAWGFAVAFPLVYLNLITRWRKHIGAIECVAMGAVGAFLLAQAFFVTSIALGLLGPLPYMIFFPGVVLVTREAWFTGGSVLGAILAPAGALSGWIFWQIGVAPAARDDNTEIF